METACSRSRRLNALKRFAGSLILMGGAAASLEANLDPVANPGEPAHPAAHYRAVGGWVGDVHPFHWRDKWWMAYLEVPTGPMRRGLYGLRSGLATSEDLLTWTAQEISIDDPGRTWWLIGMHAEEDMLYAFYNGSHGFDLATSTDGLHWQRHEASPVVSYTREQFARMRDPSIFKVGEGDYRMFLTTRLNRERPHWETGAFASLRSSDLISWSAPEVLYSPGNMGEPECPEMFRMGEWYYLVGSPGTYRVGRGIYRMSDSPDGPWERGATEGFDGADFPAPNSAGDGTRRLMWSWVPTFTNRRDFETTQWGGHLTFPREIYADEDGSLYARAPKELEGLREKQTVASADKPAKIEGKWERKEGGWITPTGGGFARLWLPGSHHRFEVVASLTLDEDCREAGVFFRGGDTSFTGYEVVLSPEKGRLQIRQHLDNHRSLATHHAPIPLNREIELRVFVDGDIVEVFLDGRYSLVTRAHQFPASDAASVGFFTNGGGFGVRDIAVHELKALYSGVEPPPPQLEREPDVTRPGGSVLFPTPYANGFTEAVPALEMTGSMTLACWFLSPPELGGFKRNLIAKADNRRGYHYGLNLLSDRSIEMYMKTSTGFAGSSSGAGTVPSTGEWTFVAGVFDSEKREIRLYRDGVELHRLENVEGSPAPNNEGPLRIGFAAGASSSDAFIGLMDEVGVWGRALGADEIQTLWERGMTVELEEAIVGYWDFESPDVTGQFPSLLGTGRPMGLFDGAKAFAESARPLHSGEVSN